MATGVAIDSVTTADAVPAIAPHRISAKTTKDRATVKFTPHDDAVVGLRPPFRPGPGVRPGPSRGARKIVAVRLTIGGVSVYTGVLVGWLGMVCSESLPCSESLTCSDFESSSDTQLSAIVTYALTGGPPDGPETVNVWTNFEGTWV